MTESGPAQTTDADREFFRLGKWLNVVLTGAFLLLLGMYLGRTFTLLGTVNLVVLIGLAAFLPRSAYFQPEPLYYIYFFLTWAVSLAVLKHNQVWLYAVLGLAAGLAYLAKASVAPLLVVFLLASTYRFFGAFFPLLLGGGGDGRHHGSEWSCLNHFIGLVFLAFTYLLTTGPRLEYAHSYYGDPFHTYPSYWMWMESFDEGYAWMNEHPTKEQLDAIPEDKVPSLENYLATHTGAEVWGRLRDGVGYVVTRFLNPPERVQKADDPRPWNHVLTHRGYYLAYLTLALVLTGLFYTRHRKASIFPHQRVDPAAVPVILFVLGAVAAYALAYGWYAPIGKGDRFMLALYGPLAFSLMAGAESLILRVRRRGECLWILHTYTALQAVLAAALAFRIVQIFQNPRFGG